MEISTTELASVLGVSPQRISAISKTCNVAEEETRLKGRVRVYSRTAVKKVLSYRGLDYDIKRFVAFENNKGGVGKTSLATTVAKRLHSLGFDVLVVDIDPQANTSSFLLKGKEYKYSLFDHIKEDDPVPLEKIIVEVEPGLMLIPSNLRNGRLDNIIKTEIFPLTYFREIVKSVHANFVIFDMSPYFNRVNFLATAAADLILIPTLLTQFSVDGVELTYDHIRSVIKQYEALGYNPEVKCVINGFNQGVSTQLDYIANLKALGVEMAKTIIRQDNNINRNQANQIPELAPNMNFYKDIAKLTDEIIGLSNLPQEVNPQAQQLSQ